MDQQYGNSCQTSEDSNLSGSERPEPCDTTSQISNANVGRLLPELNKARIFSSFDAKDGFYQVGLDQESSKLTTFWTPLGRYRYLRMPFGISLAPEVFESRLQECLADLPGVKVIRDDILVVGYGETDSEALLNHDQNVVRLLE